MAMNALRKGAKSGIVKFFLMGLMTLAVAGLVLMDMGGFFRGGVTTGNVAKIDGEPITTTQFNNIVRNTLSRQGLDSATAYQLGLINQILNSEINTIVIRREAYKLGIQISDDIIAAQVGRLVAPFVTADMGPKQALERILMNQGMSEAQFTQNLRTQIANTLVKNSVQLSASYTSDEEAALLYQYENEARNVQAILLPNDEITDYQEPSDEVLLPFYQAGKERYAIPQTRTFTLAVLGPEDLEETVSVSEEELREIYEDEIISFEQPERRALTQAVLTDKTDALAVADQIKNEDVNLESAVKAVTGDTDAYLGRETFQKGGLVEDIAVKAFHADPGDVIGPVETPLGWHVLVLKEVIEPDTQPFEEVKEQLRQDVLMDRTSEQIYLMAGEIDDMLASGTPLEEVAGELDMELTEVGPVHEDGSTPQKTEGLKQYEQDRDYILELAFEALEGESSPVIELSDGGLAVVRVDEVTARSYQPFDEVRDSLAELWIQDQKEVLNKQRARDILAELGGGETGLKAVAKDRGKSVKTYRLTRNDTPPEPLASQTHEEIFTARPGNYLMSRTSNGFIVGTVASISLPEIDELEEDELEAIKTSSTRNLQNSIYLTYLQHLRGKYDVSINERALDQMFGPGSEQY